MSAMVKVVIVVLAVILMLQCSCYATLSKKDRKIGSTKPSKPGNEVGQCFPLVLYQKKMLWQTQNMNLCVYWYLHVYGYLGMGTWCVGFTLLQAVLQPTTSIFEKGIVTETAKWKDIVDNHITFGIKMSVTGAACQSTH